MIRFGFSLIAACLIVWCCISPDTQRDIIVDSPPIPPSVISTAPTPVPESIGQPMGHEGPPAASKDASDRSSNAAVAAADSSSLGRRVVLTASALQQLRAWIAAGDCDVACIPEGQPSFLWCSADGDVETPMKELARFESPRAIRIALSGFGDTVRAPLGLTVGCGGSIIIRLNRLKSAPTERDAPLILAAGSDGTPQLRSQGESDREIP